MITPTIITTIEQWSEGFVLVVPTPAPSQIGGIFQRHIKDDVASDPTDATLSEHFHKSPKIISPKEGIESSTCHKRTLEQAIRGCCGGIELCGKLIVSSQPIQSSYRCDDLHARSRAHALMMSMSINQRICGEIIDTQPKLAALHQWQSHERI